MLASVAFLRFFHADIMWSFGKAHGNIWSTIIELSRRHNASLETSIDNLISVTSSTAKPTLQIPESALAGTHNDQALGKDCRILVIWDSALGSVPFSSPEILSKLVSLPCTSNASQFDQQHALSTLTAICSPWSGIKSLNRLIVVTGASFSSLDLNSIFTFLFQPSSGDSTGLFDSIEAIDIFIGESPSKAPVEVRERVKRKIAPISHTPLDYITLHPLNNLYTPISNNIFQLHCDPATWTLGISNTNLTSHSSSSKVLDRPKGYDNRVNMNIEYDMLSREVKERFEALARTFSALGAETGFRLEAWSLGPTSQLLSQQLTQSMLGLDTSTGGEKVSLIFVDRNLDFLSPLSCGSKSFLDKYCLLQKYHLLSKDSSSAQSSPQLTNDMDFFDEMKAILFQSPKEASSALLRKLSEIATDEGLEIDFSAGGRKALTHFYAGLVESESGRSKLYAHRKLLLLLDTVVSMQEEAYSNPQLAALLSSFKHILSAPQESPLPYITDYIEATKDVPVTIVMQAVISMLMLSTFISPSTTSDLKSKLIAAEEGAGGGGGGGGAAAASAVGVGSAQKPASKSDTCSSSTAEQSASSSSHKPASSQSASSEPSHSSPSKLLSTIESLLSHRLFHERASLPSPLPRWLHSDSSLDAIQSCIKVLFSYVLSESPPEFEDFFTVQESPTEPCLLAQIVSRVFDNTNPDLRDIKLASMSLGGLLKSGLSMVSLRHQPRPNDRHTVILFVLGGLTFHEARETFDMFSRSDAAKQNKNRLLLASNFFPSSLELADLYCM